MSDNYLMIIIGVVLIATSVFAKGISYGMPSTRQKPVYPVTLAIRIILLSFALLFLALGLARTLADRAL